MSTKILARDLIPGDAFSARTPYGTVSHLVTAVEVTDSAVKVWALRYYRNAPSTIAIATGEVLHAGTVDDWSRVFKSDALIHFKGSR